MGDHKEFLKRITKTLYYGQLPALPCLSLPVTEISCELWSVSQRGRSLRRLHADAAASIARSACVSPCALVLAILYLERLNSCNPDYLAAAAPADLFLVSLMVGNKFLQDDGEDDDVVCSEWAASGGLELSQLKKLEVEFLNAIDWNVFVSDKTFEAGLSWLERRVALKQARLRGFFTYGDLAAASEARLLAALARGLGAACAALALAYVTSLLALLAPALLLAPASSPASSTPAGLAPLDTLHTDIITHNLLPEPNLYTNNATVDLSSLDLPEEQTIPDSFKCCTKWTTYQDSMAAKRNWYDAIVIYDWKSFEPWWSKTSVLVWLYQSSLVNPMQRWLDKLASYSELAGGWRGAGCGGCLRPGLNLSKLSERDR
ncbi:protein CNPPD1 isoform X2 [Trichoplusia ni]|nr:protein CNPPD1 isoform X2 [Trichoplusia ni]XP_026742591.1 protein CNPPD1 isoform X2 [Trichoplusia ni]